MSYADDLAGPWTVYASPVFRAPVPVPQGRTPRVELLTIALEKRAQKQSSWQDRAHPRHLALGSEKLAGR